MVIFSGVTQLNGNNGWQDWGWTPHYLTNNPSWNGNYTMALAASGSWQAWYLEHDPIDTSIYTAITFRLDGGSIGGQTVGLQAQAGSNWGPQIQVTAPTDSWQQFTFPLSALGVNNITNLQAIQIWNSFTAAPPTFYLSDVRLVAAPAPATVHVSVSTSQLLHTVNPDMLGVNQVAWDGAIQTPTTTNLLSLMGDPCLRWPGGSWGDGYHWTNEAWNAGNASARNWGSFSTNFMWTATNTRAQAFIIVNYGTSDASEAAFGVRMFNITNHCNFKYWEIGNEVGGSWEWDWQYPAFATNDILNLSSLANKLETPTDNISTNLRSWLSSDTLATLNNYSSDPPAYDAALRWALVNDINNLMYNNSQSIYWTDPNRFAGVTFRPLTWTNLALPIPALGQDLANRMTLEDAYPELAKLTPAVNLASNWPNVYLPHDPWTYAMRFKNYYTQMKAADPTIKIGAVADVTEDGTVNYTNHPVVNPRTGLIHYGWTPVMLTYMRSNDCIPDFLVEHIYGPADGDTQDLLWYSKIKSDAANLRQMLTDYLGSAGSNVTLECTECGLGGDRQSCSLVGGLTYLDSLGEFLQTEFQSHIWWDFRNGQNALGSSDPSYYGWRTNSSGQYLADGGVVDGLGAGPSTRYPTYYCAELAAKFIRGGDQVVAATSDYPLLATYAVLQPDGALNLLIINKSSYTNLTVAFNLSGYVPSPNATTWSYGIPQDNAAETGIGSCDIAQGSLSGAAASFNYTFAPYSATVIDPVPTAPVLTALPGPPSGWFTCQLQGSSDVPYVIQTTTDLAAGDWVPISTNTLTAGPRGTIPLNITNNTSSSAFYRAVWMP